MSDYESDYKQGTEEQRPDMNPWGFKPNPKQIDFEEGMRAFVEFINGMLGIQEPPPKPSMAVREPFVPQVPDAQGKLPGEGETWTRAPGWKPSGTKIF